MWAHDLTSTFAILPVCFISLQVTLSLTWFKQTLNLFSRRWSLSQSALSLAHTWKSSQQQFQCTTTARTLERWQTIIYQSVSDFRAPVVIGFIPWGIFPRELFIRHWSPWTRRLAKPPSCGSHCCLHQSGGRRWRQWWPRRQDISLSDWLSHEHDYRYYTSVKCPDRPILKYC